VVAMDGGRGGFSSAEDGARLGTNPSGCAGPRTDLANGVCVLSSWRSRGAASTAILLVPGPRPRPWGARRRARPRRRVCSQPSGEHLESDSRLFPAISSSHPAELQGEGILLSPGKVVPLPCKYSSPGPAFPSKPLLRCPAGFAPRAVCLGHWLPRLSSALLLVSCSFVR